jgi:micrococcal nuclease
LGIDTPEIGECYYQEAKDFLRSKIDNQEVVLESDITDTDKYGRLLRHVFVETDTGREHVNYQLVEQGFAEVLPIPPDRAYRSEFKAAETAAKNERRGRFGGCQ